MTDIRWIPKIEDVVQPPNSGGAMIWTAYQESLKRLDFKPVKQFKDNIGVFGFEMDKGILCAKGYVMGYVVSCHKFLLEKALELKKPLVMFINKSDKFYGFDPRLCLDKGTENKKGDAVMVNFDINIGENKEKEVEQDKVYFFDLETDDRKPLKTNPEDGRIIAEGQILSFAIVDYFKQEVYYEQNDGSTDGEKKLLLKFMSFITPNSVFSAWNGKFFDMPYVYQRMKANNIKFKRFQHLDYMQLVEKNVLNDLESYALDFVARHFLKDQAKIEGIKGGNGNIYNLWLNNPELLKRYNIKDVELMCLLEEKLKFMQLHFKLAKDTNTEVSKTLYSSVTWENLIKKEYPDVVFPKIVDVSKGQYSGGYTICLAEGLHDLILVFDFVSLYPSIMITYNISWETLLEDGHTEINFYETLSDVNEGKSYSSVMFSKVPGMMPTIMIKLINERAEINKHGGKDPKNIAKYLAQWSKKIQANSGYGLLGYSESKFYSRKSAEAITTTARRLIKEARKKTEGGGFQVVGGDTDSLFIKSSGNPDQDIQKLNEIYKKHFDKILPEGHRIRFDYEKSWKRMYFHQKKNYAFLNMDDSIGFKGMACIKTGFAKVGKNLQKTILEILLREGATDVTAEKIHNLLLATRDRIMNHELTIDELIFSKRINRELNEYGGVNKNGHKMSVPLHVRLVMRKAEGENTTKVRYIITGRDDNDLMDGVLEEDYEKVYDEFYYWQTASYQLVYPILKKVFTKESFPKYAALFDDFILTKGKIKKLRNEKLNPTPKPKEKTLDLNNYF